MEKEAEKRSRISGLCQCSDIGTEHLKSDVLFIDVCVQLVMDAICSAWTWLRTAVHRVDGGCWGPDGPLEGLSEDASPPWQYDMKGRGLGPGSTAPGRSVYVGDALSDIEGLLEVCTGKEADSTG